MLREHKTPCSHCGSVIVRVELGKGPHAAALYCDGCGKFHSWLGKAEFNQMPKHEQPAKKNFNEDERPF